jgi:HK97 gp10 family phage protein
MSETIIGLEAFLEKLRALERSVQRQALTKAVRAGAEEIRQQAAGLAPRETGNLASAQTIQIIESRAEEVIARIGPGRKGFYGLFQELGTRRAAAQPFLKPAFDQRQRQALEIASWHLKESIEKAVR